MAEIQLHLLGSPRLERGGTVVEPDTRKAIALLAYLVMTGETHSREALAALLWPEFDATRSRAALRRTLSSLKKALGGEQLEASRETIGLSPAANLWVDVQHYHRTLEPLRTHGHPVEQICTACVRPLRGAVELYRGDFLEGFTLRDSANFDDWQFFQTDALRRSFAGVLEKLVYALTAQGMDEAAIAHGHRWLALDPLREEAHRTLMSLYAWAGQRNAALRQYRDCVRILDEQLGVPPLEETTQLYQAIVENQLPHRPHALPEPSVAIHDGSPPDGSPVAWAASARGQALISQQPARVYPLVGREAEWEFLLDACTHVGPDGRLVVLEGEPGIGKTRLGEDFLAYVQSRGAVTLSGRSYEGERELAYAPFIEVLRVALDREGALDRLATLPPQWAGAGARLLPELDQLVPEMETALHQEGPAGQMRFFEGVAQLILALCAGDHPGVLFLDDVHWADDATLELVSYLGHRLRGRPLFLLLTWRKDDIPPGHRLRGLAAQAQRDGRGGILPLSRLAIDDIRVLVEAREGQDLPAATLENLFQQTEGVPFFVVEQLKALVSGGEQETGALWELPVTVRNLLDARLAEAGEIGSQLLSGAAVIGRSFDYETLRAASGRSEDEVVAALEHLLRKGLVREISGGDGGASPRYDFTHDQLRRLVYQETSLARRRLLHRRVAETLQGRASRPLEGDALAGQIAQHYHLAGQDGLAAVYYARAGNHARDLYANHEALAHYRAALALDHPERVPLLLAVGDLLILLGDYESARTHYETAAALSEAVDLGRVEHKLGIVHHRMGAPELAERHFQDALKALGTQERTGRTARVYADWSLAAHQQGNDDRAQNLAVEALRYAEEAQDDRALAQAHNILGVLARGAADLPAARHHLEQSLALGERLQDPGIQVAAMNNLALVAQSDDDLTRAGELLQTALELCIFLGDRHREAALRNNLSDLLYQAGRSEEAMEHLKQAVVIFSEIGGQPGDWQPEIWKLVEW